MIELRNKMGMNGEFVGWEGWFTPACMYQSQREVNRPSLQKVANLEWFYL